MSDMRRNDKYIGAPFKWNGRDMNGFDCLGLVKQILQDDGITIPDQISSTDNEKRLQAFTANIPLWTEIDLKPGGILLFRIPGAFHVGYYEGEDRFIHTWEKSAGVVRERFSSWKQRLIGVYEYA